MTPWWQPRCNPWCCFTGLATGYVYRAASETHSIVIYTVQTGQYSTQIFSLAVLLSSLFVYNQMGGIDEAALDRLSLVTEVPFTPHDPGAHLREVLACEIRYGKLLRSRTANVFSV